MKLRAARPNQLDFWPELLTRGMLFYAHLTKTSESKTGAATPRKTGQRGAGPQRSEDRRRVAPRRTPSVTTGRNGTAAEGCR